MKIFSLLLPLTMLFSLNTSAAFIDRGTHIEDTATGMDWLKLTASTNKSYDYVTSNMGTGQEFEGWTHASIAEWDQLMINYGATTMTCGTGLFCGWLPANDGVVSSVLSDFGGITGQFYGITSDIQGAKQKSTLMDDDSSAAVGRDNEDLLYSFWTALEDDRDEEYLGHWLARSTTEVPIPAAAWLFGSGLLGLVGMAKRKKA